MKVKFTKLAALLLAGVALFATGCTDYEVDIQKVDKKVDNLTTEVNGKIASLEQQIAGINATIATLETKVDHDKDIAALNKTISDLETALRAALDTKVDKEVYTAKMTEIAGKIQNLEAADENFKNQIQDIVTELAKKVNQTDFDQAVADLTSAINGEITRAKAAEAGLQAAIDEINNKTIPALEGRVKAIENELPTIRQKIDDLDKGKLAKTEFDDYYKAAYEKYTKATIEAIQGAIGDLTKLKTNDKTSLVNALNEVWAKFDDYVLKETFDAFVEIAATKEELTLVQNALQGQIDGLKALIGEFPEGTTVRKYIDDKVAGLQAQIDKIVKELIPALDARVADLEDKVNNTILPQIKFAIGYESKYAGHVEGYDFANGLQGYIQDMAMDTFIAACQYADQEVAKVRKELNAFKAEMYDLLSQMLKRIQSIVYVPDYDDLKITTNVAAITVPVKDAETKENLVELVDQPFRVTYKITPAVYAEAATEFLSFDIKPVNTRDAEADAENDPRLEILKVVNVDAETGEVTLLVQAFNVASNAYLANANQPHYDVNLRWGGYPGVLNGTNVWGTDHETRDFIGDPDEFDWTIPVWRSDDLKAYKARSAFAAALQLYNPDIKNENLEDVSYQNEISSNYNVLYPACDLYEIPEDPWKRVDGDKVREFKEDEVWQTLSYNSSATRVILENAVPVVIIDDEAYGLFPDKVENGFHVIKTSDDADPILIPEVKISDKAEISYSSGANEEMYVVNPATYATVNMDLTEPASERKLEIGNVVSGTYTFTSLFGSFDATGYVRIVKEQGSINAAANAVWTWNWNKDDAQGEDLGDALVDHNLYYKVQDGPQTYVRLVWDFEPVAADVEAIKANLGLQLADIFANAPASENPDRQPLVIEVADRLNDKGEVVDPENLEFKKIFPAEAASDPTTGDAAAPAFEVTNFAVVDGQLVADFLNFDWDKVYKITAIFETEEATITLNGTFTTYDRNRKPVMLDLYSYTFGINEFDEETGFGYYAGLDNKPGYYYWKTESMNQAIFDKFVAGGVIDVNPAPVRQNFKDFADVDEFFEGELHDKTQTYEEDGVTIAGTANPYVIIRKKTDIFGETRAKKQITAAALKEMNSGESEYEYKLRNNLGNDGSHYVFMGDTLYRNITSYIGEKIVIPFMFNYRVPAYDFLHQTNYTFKDKKDAKIWYTMASPKYDYNKKALKHYDVEYMNVPALAFNIIDERGRYFNYKDEVDPKSDKFFYNENLFINFDYTKAFVEELENDPVLKDSLEKQSRVPVAGKEGDFIFYKDLWFDAATEQAEYYNVDEAKNFEHTVFYYRSTRDQIPMVGILEIDCDGVRFEIPTSFEKDNDGKYSASKVTGEKLDYSTFELRAWKPFYVPTYQQTLVIKLDEHDFYRANVLEGLQFFDGRQVAASTPLDEVKDPFVEGTYKIDAFNDGTVSYFRPMLGFNEDPQMGPVWGWIRGNVDINDPATAESGNGYVTDDGRNDVTSWTAYDLQKKSFVFDTSGIPVDLRRLIEVNKETYEMTFDYNSQIQFSDVAKISFSFDLQSPWQKFEKPFTVIVEIRGLNAQ